MDHLRKGDFVQVSLLLTHPVGLTGMQMKFGAQHLDVKGVVAHIRGDHPTNPTVVGVWLKDDERLQTNGTIGSDLRVTCEKCGKPEVGPLDVKYLTGCTPSEG